MSNRNIWIHYARPRPHWYRLNDAEKAKKAAVWAEAEELSKAQGAVCVGRYHIRGQHDFQSVQVWQFTSPEAAFDHWDRLTSVGYNEWNAFTNNIGMELNLPIGQNVESAV